MSKYRRTVRLTPRYGDRSVLCIVDPVRDPSVALMRQRRRLESALTGLGSEQWIRQSRCGEWSVRDVVCHLASINGLWATSIAGALAGEPTRLFDSFDPVAIPALLVEAERRHTAEQALTQFIESNDVIEGMVSDLDSASWSKTGETPLGHVPLHAVAVHALWDAWIHERDILLPLGIALTEEEDEVIACLRHAAVLSPVLLACRGSTRRAAFAVEATEPSVQIRIDVGASVVVREGPGAPGAVRIHGSAVHLVEALSLRAPPRFSVADEDAWLFRGLAEAFDVEMYMSEHRSERSSS